MADEDRSIKLGLPEFQADDIHKAQVTDNIFAIHRALEHLTPESIMNVQYLVECFMTTINPYKKQEAMFQLRDKMLTEQLNGVKDKETRNEIILSVHMRIFGLCRELYYQKYSEQRLAVLF